MLAEDDRLRLALLGNDVDEATLMIFFVGLPIDRLDEFSEGGRVMIDAVADNANDVVNLPSQPR